MSSAGIEIIGSSDAGTDGGVSKSSIEGFVVSVATGVVAVSDATGAGVATAGSGTVTGVTSVTAVGATGAGVIAAGVVAAVDVAGGGVAVVAVVGVAGGVVAVGVAGGVVAGGVAGGVAVGAVGVTAGAVGSFLFLSLETILPTLGVATFLLDVANPPSAIL